MERRSKIASIICGTAGLYAGLRLAMRARRRVSFRNKVVVITGGARGLGLLLARRFADESARLLIAGPDEAELLAAKNELRQRGRDGGTVVETAVCNVRIQIDIESLIRRAVAAFGTIDVLVNNAGVISVGPMTRMTEADYQECMDIHFWGPLHAVQAALPVMRAAGGGRIVNIASIGGKIGVPHLAPYSASKSALVGWSNATGAELRSENIFVTTVCPALIRTGSPRNAITKGQHEKEYTWFALGDSLPLLSQSAESAADRIIDACRHGEPHLLTSVPAALATRFDAMLPWLSAELMALANRFILPAAGSSGIDRARGFESETPVTRSFLTALTLSAAERNNETMQQ